MSKIDIFGFNYETTSEELKELRRRDLRNLLTSYGDEADVFTEIIQNAFDALVRADKQGLYSDEKGPELNIILGKRKTGDAHYLMVTDNGTGMAPDVASKFTIPGYSANKKLGSTIGHKGVGASFFAAAANRFGVHTEDSDGQITEAEVIGAHDWIKGEHANEPVVRSELKIPKELRDYIFDGHGTSIYYEFHAGLKPSSLSHVVIKDDNIEKELQKWASFLCFKTPLGQVSKLKWKTKEPKVNLIMDDGDNFTKTVWDIGEFDLEMRTLGYPYPYRVIKVAKKIVDIQKTPEARRSIDHNRRHQALHLTWNKEDIKALSPKMDFDDQEEELFENHFEFIEVFFAYSTDLMNSIHDRVGTRARVFKHGIRIASDGAPQGRMLDFQLTSNTGLNRQAHALVSFHGLELDLGRKIPSSEAITELVYKISRRAMNILSDYRWAMKVKDRPDPSYDIQGWSDSIRANASDSLVKTYFDAVKLTPPINVDPDSENDVIALFSGLCALDILKGYGLKALSGFKQYDALVEIERHTDVLRDLDDPISIRSDDVEVEGEFRVLEFKLWFNTIFEDFDRKEKVPSDIDLLVCWSLPEINVPRGRIKICYGENRDHRPLYGVTYIWEDDNGSCSIPIISLKHLIIELLASHEVRNGITGIGRSRLNDVESKEKIYSL